MSVSSLIADARSYSASVLDGAEAALESAVDAMSQVGYTQITYNPVPLPGLPTVPSALVAPVLDEIALDLPAEPDDSLLFQDISPIDAGVVPVFTGVAPTITLPNKPNQLAEFGVPVPTINTSFAFPDAPAALLAPLPSAPTLPERTEPTKPQITLPAFTAVMPEDAPEAPSDLQTTFENAYAGAAASTIAMMEGYVDAYIAKYSPRHHEQMGRIETQLATYLDGGTALDPAAEDAIYERSRSKASAEARRVREAAYKETAQRGFTIPGATIVAALRKARQDAASTNAAAAREIVVMQAEMEQKNLQFAVTTSAGLRTAMVQAALSYHQNLISINAQALDYAKAILNTLIEVFNIAAKVYGMRLDAYKAEAAVYETKMKGALASIELYKAEIAALEAMTSVDRAKVAVYEARIDALTALSGVYRSQIEAALGRASLEKLKIDLFGTQVQAYGASVNAKTAEWQGYAASINGESSKVDLYSAQLRGHVSQLEAFKTTLEAKVEEVRAIVASNQSIAQQYTARIAGYSSVVEARGGVARTRLENQRQRVIAFQAESQAQVANAQLRNEHYRTTGEIAIKNATLSIDAMFKSAELARGYAAGIAGLHSSNASIHGSVAGSALSGMNTLAAQSLTE